MRQLAQEYWDIFLSELNPSSVEKLPAMELAVNEAKWQVEINTTPRRLQSLIKKLKNPVANSKASQFVAN